MSQFQIHKITEFAIVEEFFQYDPLLMAQSLPDGGIDELSYSDWYGFYLGQCLLALVATNQFTNSVLTIHPYVGSTHWGTGLSDSYMVEFKKYLEKTTQYIKIMVHIPHVCHSCVEAALRQGFQIEGHIKAGALWRGELRDLIVMTQFIRRSS